MNAPLSLETEPTETAIPANPSVQEILATIERDSQTRPEQYLADTVVPFGGE